MVQFEPRREIVFMQVRIRGIRRLKQDQQIAAETGTSDEISRLKRCSRAASPGDHNCSSSRCSYTSYSKAEQQELVHNVEHSVPHKLEVGSENAATLCKHQELAHNVEHYINPKCDLFMLLHLIKTKS